MSVRIDFLNEGPIALSAGVRLLHDGDGAIRLRTGVWNFEEATIDLSTEPEHVARTISRVFAELETGGIVELSASLDGALDPIERANVAQLFSDLTKAGFVEPPGAKTERQRIADALLGYWKPHLDEALSAQKPDEGPLLVLADRASARQQAEQLAAQMQVEVRDLPPAVAAGLATADLTTQTDSYQVDRVLHELRPQLGPYSAIVGVFEAPSIQYLRNLNRLIGDSGKPWALGIVDGPFVTLLGIRPPYTGCFECFELRTLARLQDHVVYRDFVQAHGNAGPAGGPTPVLNVLVTLAMSEAFLWTQIGMSRISGRLLSVYLPTLEIQAQSLLRMPGCPACGRVSRQEMNEMNFSTRAVLDRVITKALEQ